MYVRIPPVTVDSHADVISDTDSSIQIHAASITTAFIRWWCDAFVIWFVCVGGLQ